MINLPYSLVIETTEEPDFFGFYSPDLEGFTGIGHSVEDCIYQARHGMAEHIQPRGGSHHGRQSAQVMRIQQTECRFQSSVRNPRFSMHFNQIEDGDTGRFTAGACRRRYRDQGF